MNILSKFSREDSTLTQAQRRSTLKNRIFIAIIVIANAFGNLFLAIGMKDMPDFGTVGAAKYVGLVLINPWIVVGVVTLAVWMTAQLTMYTWADLSYVLPITASGYIVTTFLGKFYLGENVSIARWVGVVLISFGAMLGAETPPRMHLPEEGEIE